MPTPDPRLADLLADWAHRPGRGGGPPLIGIAGGQGSGKTTLARAAAKASGAVQLSIDDVYLTRAEREQLARERHPLLRTRGPPGTHDLDLATRTLARLRAAGPGEATPLPSFDKLADERRPEADWPLFTGRPAAIILEGWCVGAMPQPPAALEPPLNLLESAEDADGRFRRLVNDKLAGPYRDFFAAFDAILFLAAPSWAVVLDWRCEQEAGLLGIPAAALPAERRAGLARFVAHYERISRHMLAGGVRAEAVARLGEDRAVLSLT